MKKRIITLVLALVLVLPAALMLNSCDGYDIVLNVYNWGQYISNGEEDTLDINKEFEKYYLETYGKKLKVNYTTYDSNEVMRARLESGAASYDVIIPSDYMIEYLIENDMLLKLDYKNIPNFTTNIDERFKNLFYDPQNEYTVPYFYGRVGVIYDANAVSEEDLGSWDILWNEKYSGKIVQYNNSRDAFGMAMYKLGIDVNTTDTAEWDRAFNELKAQKPLVQGYYMDEIFNAMETGNAAVSSYYAGDYFTMVDNQSDSVDLQFFYPEATNVYVDAMCIPTSCQNKEAAERYIDFLTSQEIAIANAEYTYYASPNSAVYNSEDYKEYIGEETYAVLYPDNYNFAEDYAKYAYRNLDETTLGYVNKLWDNLFK